MARPRSATDAPPHQVPTMLTKSGDHSREPSRHAMPDALRESCSRPHGMVPTEHSSGGTHHRGSITRAGTPLDPAAYEDRRMPDDVLVVVHFNTTGEVSSPRTSYRAWRHPCGHAREHRRGRGLRSGRSVRRAFGNETFAGNGDGWSGWGLVDAAIAVCFAQKRISCSCDIVGVTESKGFVVFDHANRVASGVKHEEIDRGNVILVVQLPPATVKRRDRCRWRRRKGRQSVAA
jgi:hypothetical protein